MIKPLVLLAALATLVPSHVRGAGDLPPGAAHYRVSYLGDNRFRVEADLGRPTLRLDLNASTPPERPEGQAASVHNLEAFDARGRAVPVDYVGESTWQLKHGAAHRIRYELVADHDAATWRAGKEEVASKFDQTYYFVGDAFFLIDYAWPKAAITIDFDLPADWRVTGPWDVQGHRAIAAGPVELGSNAFALGVHTSRQSRGGGLQLEWLADSRVEPGAQALSELFDVLPAAYAGFWGGSPGDRLNIFLLSDSMTDGGAFKNSFAMRLDTPLREAEQPIWMFTMAHELMHIWMNQSNEGIGRAPGGSHYWFTEGFTDYLTLKLMRQSGLLDRTMAGQRVANLIRRYLLSRKISPGIDMMTAGDKKHDNWELVYGGGAVVALLLDAELSQDSPTAFRNLLRALQHQGGRAMDGKALLAELDNGSGGRASEIFRQLDQGMPLSAIRTRLAKAGIGVEGYGSDEVYVTFDACRTDRCPELFWAAPEPR